MAHRISFNIPSIALILLLGVASSSDVTSVQYTYSGSHGPENWGTLSLKFSACSNGKQQSPVNIKTNETVLNKNLRTLSRSYKPANATLVNNGFNIGIEYEGNSGTLNVDGENYTLKHMHWHSPSEHQIDGVQFPAELHLVHQSDSGSLSVVSILFQYGDADPFIAKIQNSLNELAGEVCSSDEVAQIALGNFDNKLLRKSTRKYYRYVGSLTSPPCTENVTWNILGKVRTISKEQVEALKAPLDEAFKQNARPLQSLNGRKIEMYHELSN